MAIYKNDNGTWYVMIRYQDWTGARKQKCKRGFSTRKEAADWELQFKLQKKASVDMTMESFCTMYEEDVRPSLKQSTWLTKENIIQKKILPYLGKRKVSEITAKDVMDWHNQMRKLKTKTGKPLSPTYLKTIHGQLSTIFNHAVKYYDLSTNPARKAGALGEEEGKEMLFWTKEEYKRFAEEMMDKPLSYYAFQNVDPDRVHLNICYQNENLKEVYKELFDDSVKRYNVGKRKDRQITNYYEKIRQGKQEKLFHEVIFQIGNREDMAVGTTEGDLAVKVLDEYVKNFQQRNPTLHVFNCYLHQDEATPHLHIDFVPYVTGWKGKGMDTRVSLKQALKSLGFQGGNKHDTELNQWINHEKELLAEIARQHGIEWEQKGTHEEHLDVYNFKKKERKKEVQALEQEKEYLTAENEGLTAQIAETRADIQLLKDDKEQAVKDKEEAEKRAEKAEKDLHSLEERRERLQPVMDNVSKEIKEYGTVKTLLPEAGTLERATTYRDKKIKPLFTQMKNKIAAMAALVKELTKEVEKWKQKYQETKQAYNRMQRKLDTMREEKEQLSEEKQQLQGVSDRYDRVVRVLGENVVEDAVQKDIQEQKALEEKRQIEQMPKGSIHERLAWGARKSEMENQQRKKNKTKNRGMER